MSQKIKKAIEKPHHGLNIYAYYHMQTKQVVYSLTRIMQVRIQRQPCISKSD